MIKYRPIYLGIAPTPLTPFYIFQYENVNAAFHQIIWTFCQREILSWLLPVQWYNTDGVSGKLNILIGLGITGSHYTRLNFLQSDKKAEESMEQLKEKRKVTKDNN